VAHFSPQERPVGGFGLSRERFGLLFAVMLVAAAGNTAMQSLLPAIGRSLGIADLWVAVAFSLSAILWVVTAPYWAKRADVRGRRALMRLGLIGFIASMLVCGGILAAGLAGWISGTLAFVIFTLGRALYGGWGSASPPAVQAYIAARTDGDQRTGALAAIASSFGLGTIIGPAIAPLFIFAPLGLAGPLIVFAAIGFVVLALIALRLPDDTPRNAAQGRISDYPAIGTTGGARQAETEAGPPKLRWRDPRVWRWLIAGMVGGHGQAIMLGVVGFLVIDRLGLTIEEAQHDIAVVLIGGAVASLLAQWWLIPQLQLKPTQLVVWGGILASLGAVLTGISTSLYTLTLSFALASVGFGLFRPGFTSGASLAVEPHEQNAVAGMVTSVNGIAYVAAPALGVGLYAFGWSLPFVLTGAVMLGLALWGGVSLRLSPRAGASASPD
jgi:MFS family permease